MKSLFVFSLVCLATLASAQTLSAFTLQADGLANQNGYVMQYGFPTSAPTAWNANQQGKKYKWDKPGKNELQIRTVTGVSEVWLQDSHGYCATNAGTDGMCTYFGIINLKEKSFSAAGGSSSLVTATASGIFTDAGGNMYPNVKALLYFETYPAIDGVYKAAPAGFIVVLEPNQ